MLRLGSLLLVATLTAVALSQTTTTANTTVASNTTVQITSTATPTTAVPPTTIPSGTPTVVNTIVIGNFGPVAGTDTFQSPSLPSGSYLPYKSDWPTVAAQVLNSYRATIAAMYPYSNLAAPTIINTQGRIFIGLSNLFANMSVTMPQVVIVIDSYEVSRAIQTSIVQSYGSSVLVIMALASSQDSNFASTAVAPATIRLAPSDQNTATNIIAAMQKLSWQAFSLVQSSDDYGDNFVASITSQITTSALAPKLLVQERLVGWGVSGRDAADEAAITRIAAGGAVGVVGCGGPGFAARVINAYLRAAAKSAAVSSAGLFFLFTPPAMMDFPQFVPPDKTSGLPFTNHAIFAPIYTNRATLTGFDTLSYAGDGLAFALSYVLDALTVVAAAAQNNFLTGQVTNSTSLLRAAVALNITTGTLTGPISFDSSTNNRVQQTYNVIQLPLNPRDSATIFGTSTSSTVVLNSAASVIPQSLLTTAEICVIGSTLCSDYANVNHAIVTLLDANAATPVDSTAPRLPTGISFKIVAIATGTDGVNAISALAKYGRACDIILGPSKFSLMVAVNPLVSYYGIPTLDYGSTSPLLSDKLTYPTYARVLQPDTVMIKAMSALFVQYQWSSVGVITTKDAYGSAFLNQMTTSPVMIEKTYLVETTAGNDAAIGAAMIDIRDNLISRIIVVAMPATDSKMAALFSNIFALDSATLKTLVFYFSDAVCQYLALNPSIRARLLGSMCATPAYDAAGYATKYAQLASAYNAAALPYLTAGGFSGCSQSYTDMYSPFAHDAAWAITDTLNRMIKANGGTLKSQNATGGATILYNGTAVLASLLNTSITGATGALSFTSTADRASESYNFTIQQNGYVAILGTWTPNAGYKNTPQTTALVWQDNTTTVPTYSARGVVFIASKTASANPGVIVFSVLGFVLTVAGFVFAYKYHTMSKKMAGIELGDGPSVVVPAPTARA